MLVIIYKSICHAAWALAGGVSGWQVRVRGGQERARNRVLHWRWQVDFGAVAKWPKAEVCKTSIRGFDSHPRLQEIPIYARSRASAPRSHPALCFTRRLRLLFGV